MTARELERLAVVETKVDTLSQDVTEIKSDLKSVLKKLEMQEKSFVTKKAVSWTVGILVTLVAGISSFLAAFVKAH